MRSLPLFHRIVGQPVIVLGEGKAAEPKRRLVERAGGKVIADLDEGLAAGARLAFVAHAEQEACAADAERLRMAGVLVNVVDRPDLCDFTTPSLLDRDPLLIAIGTSGASAGLAKQVRLRLEGLLPSGLGALATKLSESRENLRRRWPVASDRRQALDAALGAGGALDPLDSASFERVDAWIAEGEVRAVVGKITLTLASDDPDELTLRQARLLGSADCILFEQGIAPPILDRARADAERHELPFDGKSGGLVLTLKRAVQRAD